MQRFKRCIKRLDFDVILHHSVKARRKRDSPSKPIKRPRSAGAFFGRTLTRRPLQLCALSISIYDNHYYH